MNEKNPATKGSVLVIEDNEQLATLIRDAFTKADYKVIAAKSAREAFTAIFRSPPDLIVLDINLPDLDGFHLAKELKRNMMLRHIPVILLSGRSDFLEKMKTLEVVVDEYLTIPFEVPEMLLRAQLVLERSRTNLDANPLTRLPGNIAIVKAIKERIGAKQPYAVGYADLNNFKAFNDKYGFNKGDQVIISAAKMIVSVVQRLSPSRNFIGHVGGDDFIFICDYEKANEICQAITESFDKEVPKYYSEEDREKGYIVVEDRRGVVSQFPLISIAIGLVSDEGGKFSNLGQINHSLTQLKKYAKSFQGSAYVRDRRNLAAALAEFTWGPGSSAGTSKVLENITTALGSYMPGQLADIIKNKSITVLFQPILDMRTDDVVGHEGLVRGPSGTPLEFPDALFQTARTANMVRPLDMLCIQQVLNASMEFRKGIRLFINVYPETFLEETSLHEFLEQIRERGLDLVLELSGSHRANDAVDLFATLARMKQHGVKICIDASVALMGHGLRSLPELRPEFIKLNMMSYKDMSNDFQKQSEFGQAVTLIRQVGSDIICTKLESRADSFMALKFGVFLGQGFLFAQPSRHQTPSSVK